MPPISNSVIANPRWYLPRIAGTAEKPLLHVHIGDSNSTPSTGAQAGGSVTDWSTYYHSLYVQMLKSWPFQKLGGFRFPVHVGNNPALYGQVAADNVTPASTAAIVSKFTWITLSSLAGQPAESLGGMHEVVFAANYAADNLVLWTIRGGAWLNDSDFYKDGETLEAIVMARRTTDGCATTLLRGQRSTGESGALEGALTSPTSATNAANFENATPDWVTMSVTIPAGTQTLLRVALIGTADNEQGKRATFGTPFLRRQTPSVEAPEFDSVSVGGWGIPNFAAPNGVVAKPEGISDDAIRRYIAMMVRTAGGTRLDKEIIAWIDLGTNRWGVTTQADAETWYTTLIERWSSLAALEQVPIHFVIKPPADPGTAGLTQDSYFDLLDDAALAVAAELDQPNRRVMAISMRQALLDTAPEFNGTLGGPYDASTNPTGGIVNEPTDVHRNRLGAPRETNAVLGALTQYGALRTRDDVGCTTPAGGANLRDRRPFFWVPFFGGNFANRNGVDGSALEDIALFCTNALNKAAQFKYERVVWWVTGGKSTAGQQYYGADQWSLMTDEFREWFGSQMRNECAARGITPEAYIGAVWEPMLQTSAAGTRPPVLDPLSEDDLIETHVLPWVDAGCKVIWCDAVATLTENARTHEFVKRLRDYLWHRGVTMGGEAYPTINSGGYQIDAARAYDMPYLTTEDGHNGYNNVANYVVPAGATIFDVFEPVLWNTTIGATRKAQGFIGCPWRGMTDEQIGEVAALWAPDGAVKPRRVSRIQQSRFSRTQRATSARF